MQAHKWADVQCMGAISAKKLKSWREKRKFVLCSNNRVSPSAGQGTYQEEKQHCKFLTGVNQHPPTGINSEFISVEGLAHTYIKSWMRITPSAARILKLYGFNILPERNKWNPKVNILSAIERAWPGLKQKSWAMQDLHIFYYYFFKQFCFPPAGWTRKQTPESICSTENARSSWPEFFIISML